MGEGIGARRSPASSVVGGALAVGGAAAGSVKEDVRSRTALARGFCLEIIPWQMRPSAKVAVGTGIFATVRETV